MDLNINTAKEDVLAGGDCGSDTEAGNCKDTTLLAVLNSSATNVGKGRALSLGKVAVDCVLTKGRVGRTGWGMSAKENSIRLAV